MSLPSHDIEALFERDGERVVDAPAFSRSRHRARGLEALVDRFDASAASCLFLRFAPGPARQLRLELGGAFSLASCAAGGWMLRPVTGTGVCYWIPQAAMARVLDADLHISAEALAPLAGLELGLAPSAVIIDCPPERSIDCLLWRLPAEAGSLLAEIELPLEVELQPAFTYGSHSVVSRPAELYRHLVFGWVYDTEFVWPRNWRICDELDAYALWLRMAGLHAATGKALYGLFKTQLAHSIVSRLRDDGGWYHGEWTHGMESHYRLHCGGIHLLCAALEERDDPFLRTALERACAYVASQTDRTALGTWFLHDSLEHSETAMKDCPFPWVSTTVLGKSRPNMLVLNTHLDAQIALARYGRVSGDTRYEALLASACEASRKALALRPAQALYRWLFRLIDLTLLPASQAASLPLPVRIVKRLTWKYLTPRIHRLRARFPRFVMPNGFIDRSPTLMGVAHQYLPVNIWDLVRYRRFFPLAEAGGAVRGAMTYIARNQLLAFWRETRNHKHALGFWAESLYHLAVDDPDPALRSALAEAMLWCEDAGQGMPPSLLGANTEAVPLTSRRPCPSPADRRLRVANLGGPRGEEVLLVNVSREELSPSLREPAGWHFDGGATKIAPRGFLIARRSAADAALAQTRQPRAVSV